MRRYWIPRNQINEANNSVFIEKDFFHHIVEVCRQSVGSRFEVIESDSHCFYLVEMIEIGKKRALAKIVNKRWIPELKKPIIHLAISIPRWPVFDSLIERCVELGVAHLHPFYSDFSFIRKDSSWPQHKSDRWNKIIISASQQSGRGDLMKMHQPQHLYDLVKAELSDPSKNIDPNKLNEDSSKAIQEGFFLYEGKSEFSLKSYLSSKINDDPEGKKSESIWIFIGSEGGFSPSEVDFFKKKGFPPLTLGENVLRVETACLAVLSVLKYEYDLFE